MLTLRAPPPVLLMNLLDADTPLDLASLGRTDFESQIGREFVATFAGGEELVLTLSRVRATTEAGDRPGGGFSLGFTGPLDRHFIQGTVPLRFPDGGVVSLFLVNNGPRGGFMNYEVIVL